MVLKRFSIHAESAARVNPELIPDLGWIAAKLLEKDRNLRYQSGRPSFRQT